MDCKITEKGELVLIANNDTENYTLKKWHEENNHKSVKIKKYKNKEHHKIGFGT